MSDWLLPRNVDIEFDRDEYVRPPLDERAKYYEILHGIQDGDGPAVTIEEIRREERWGERQEWTPPTPTPSPFTSTPEEAMTDG